MKEKIIKKLEEMDLTETKAFDENIYCGSGDLSTTWDHFLDELKKEIIEEIKRT
jgi:hypothetical protein